MKQTRIIQHFMQFQMDIYMSDSHQVQVFLVARQVLEYLAHPEDKHKDIAHSVTLRLTQFSLRSQI